jgi:SAM-dependent methyltransferase
MRRAARRPPFLFWGTNMGEWFNDESLWETFESHMFTPERVGATGVEVDAIIRLLAVRSGANVLDLCCGVGRHSIELARRGFNVTGVDRTRLYLDKARNLAAAEQLNVEFFQADMREFLRPNSYDAAINYFTAFGYFDDPADDLKVARNLCASLKPGGRLLLDMIGKEIVAAKFSPRDFTRHGDTIVLEERRLLDGWKRIATKWTLIRGVERRESTLTLRLYSGAELERTLLDAGFEKVDLYGRLKGTPYDQNAERLIAVATRSVSG